MVYLGHFVGFVVKKNAADVRPILIQGFAFGKDQYRRKSKDLHLLLYLFMSVTYSTDLV